MRVAFDASTSAFRLKTGTGVYCEELIKAFQNRFPGDEVIHTYRLSRAIRGWEYLLPMPQNVSREVLLDPWTYFRGHRYDIFHGLNSRLPLLARSRMVATIHDLFSIFGEFSDARFREDQSAKLLQMIGRAHHIIVPASFTKDQLEKKLNVPAAKISVVGEGVRKTYLRDLSKEESLASVREKFGVKNPFLLFVGTLEKRKNVIGCVQAYARYRQTHPGSVLDLVLVGHPGFQFEEIRREIDSSGFAGDIRILGFVEEDDLDRLYRSCEAFLFLSWEEGFGIPVIEAMACGAPVISSNSTSLPEVGGGLTWLVPPSDTEAAAKSIGDILAGGEKIMDQVAAAKAHARGLTWEKVAEDTRLVYLQILEAHP